MSRDGFSTREVLQLTGTTARQLQWWDEKHIIVPQRDGRRRLYSAENTIEVHVIEELRRRRIPFAAIRRVLKFIRRETGEQLFELALSRSEYYLLLKGTHSYLEEDPALIVNHIRSTTEPVYVICLSAVARRVEGAMPGQMKLSTRHINATANKKPPLSAREPIKKKESRGRAG